MSASAGIASTPELAASPGLWMLAARRFLRDRVGTASAAVVALFLSIMAAAAAGLVARDWQEEIALSYAPPAFLGTPGQGSLPHPGSATATAQGPSGEDLGIADPLEAELAAIRGAISGAGDAGIVDPLQRELAEIGPGAAGAAPAATRATTLALGADKWGRDVLKKAIKGTETSLFVGLASALLATLLGTLFGAQSGYYGGRLDDFFNWLYSVLTSMPYLLLVLAVAAVLGRKGTLTVILILGFTGWTGIYRLVRAEYMKHRAREYVLAADAMGASHARRMFVHILPNASHLILVQLSLHVVLFIKSEVILSFLGFGVGVDTVSWGSMLNEAQTELLLGRWWQFAAATIAMAAVVTAFSLFTDALRDALDPTLT